MASLAPPPLINQLSCSSEVSTASMYSTPEYEDSGLAQDLEQSESPPKIQYCVQRRQTLFIESALPPEGWDDEMRQTIVRQLSSAPEEISTLVHPSASSRRTCSWNEQTETATDDQPKAKLRLYTPSRSLSSSPTSISSHRLSSKPLACMPGLLNRDLPTTSSAPSPINDKSQNTPSLGRPPIRRRIYFYNREDPYYGFTNFSPHEVKYKGKVYPTSEHLFQSFKVNSIINSVRAESTYCLHSFRNIGQCLQTTSGYSLIDQVSLFLKQGALIRKSDQIGRR